MDYYAIFTLAILCTGVLYLLETVGLHMFWTPLYTLGIPVYRQSLEFASSLSGDYSKEVLIRQEGKFKFVEDKVYFISRYRFFSFRISTFLPFKITGEIRDLNTVDLTARLPLGSSLFTVMISAFCIFISLHDYIQTHDNETFYLLAMGIAFPFLAFLICYFIEKYRTRIMIQELNGILEGYRK